MILSLGPVLPVTPLAASRAEGEVMASGFSAFLTEAVKTTESSAAAAAGAMASFVAGENADVHTVALSVQKASLEFEMFLQVRNRVVQAYQEIMHLQL